MTKLENKMLRVFDRNHKLILKSPLSKNRTFKIEIDVIEQKCFTTTVNSEEWLWHYRFGHLNFRDLIKLNSREMVLGLPQSKPPSEVCDGCLQCKQSRSTFKQNVPIRAKEKLEVIYSDVCGPMQTESLGGNGYFILFIHELTRKV